MIITNHHIKGINLRTWTVKAHFNVLLPKYMEFIDLNPSTYFGWVITSERPYPRAQVRIHCEKELPYNEALPESIWFREQVQKTFKLYNHYHKSRKRKNAKLNVTRADWINDMVYEFEQRESKYVSNY